MANELSPVAQYYYLREFDSIRQSDPDALRDWWKGLPEPARQGLTPILEQHLPGLTDELSSVASIRAKWAPLIPGAQEGVREDFLGGVPYWTTRILSDVTLPMLFEHGRVSEAKGFVPEEKTPLGYLQDIAFTAFNVLAPGWSLASRAATPAMRGAFLSGEELPAMYRQALEGAMLKPEPKTQITDYPLGGLLKSVGHGVDEVLKLAYKGATLPGRIPLPQGLQTKLGVETIGQAIERAFVPGSERADKVAQYLFFNARRDIRMAENKIVDLQQALKELTPTELSALSRLVKEGPEAVVSMEAPSLTKVLGVVTKLEDIANIPKLKPALAAEFQEQFRNRVASLLDELPSQVKTVVEGSRDEWESVRRLASNVLVPMEVRTEAFKLINAYRKLPEEIMKDFRSLTYDYAIQRVKNNPNWFSRYQKPGYLYSEEAKGYLPTAVRDALKELVYVPEGFGRWFATNIMGPWKSAQILLRLPTQFRNLFGNLILNDVAGKHSLPWFTPAGIKTYADTFKRYVNHYIRGKPDKLIKEFEDLTGYAGSYWLKEEIAPLALDWTKRLDTIRGNNVLDLALWLFNKTKVPYQVAWDVMEGSSRLAKYIWNRQKGMNKLDAAIDAVRSLIDYSDVTKLNAILRNYISPFPTFQIKAATHFMRALAENPTRAVKYALIPMTAAYYGLKNLNLTEEEWEAYKRGMPDFLRRGWLLPLPTRDEKGRLQVLPLDWLIPFFGDVVNAYYATEEGKPWEAFGVHPLFDIPATIMRGEDRYGTPVYNQWDSPTTKAFKSIGYIWGQFAPGFLPGGRDFSYLYSAFRPPLDSEVSPTPKQAAATMLGFRTYTFPEEMLEQRARQNLYGQQLDMLQQMKRELGRARSEEEREEILENYRGLFDQLRGDASTLP